jgi:RNA-binding protein YlmH
MTRAEVIAKYAQSGEEKLLASRLFDHAAAAEKSRGLAYTKFLTPSEREFAKKISDFGGLGAVFDGGYDGAERTCALFGAGDSGLRESGDYPLRALRFSFPEKLKLTHRDFLGALLALGLKRETLGDILVGEGRADAVVFADVADFIRYHLERVGQARVETSEGDLAALSPAEENGKEISGTVASARLDAVLRLAYNISRGDAKTLARSGGVQVNHAAVKEPDMRLEEGDLLSVRGMGRARLLSIGETTKKGRLKARVLIVK